MKKLSSLQNIHKDKTIVVVGGGPSVMEGIKVIPKNAIIISANQHGFAAGLQPSYMVFGDPPESNPPVMKLLTKKNKGFIALSPIEEWTDYSYKGTPMWISADSGMRSVWTATYLTTGLVIVVGVDLYIGKKRYFHDDVKDPQQHPKRHLDKVNHLRRWRMRRDFKDGFIDPSRIRATGNSAIFSKYIKENRKIKKAGK